VLRRTKIAARQTCRFAAADSDRAALHARTSLGSRRLAPIGVLS
jgi:hypothetical protein